MDTGTNGHAVPRFGGRPWTLSDGTTVLTIPEFNIDEAELYLVAQEKVRAARDDPAAQRENLNEVLRIIHLAATRNHPDLTLEQFRQGLRFREMPTLAEFIARLNGLIPEDETRDPSGPGAMAP